VPASKLEALSRLGFFSGQKFRCDELHGRGACRVVVRHLN
jgi:hypothetical protein